MLNKDYSAGKGGGSRTEFYHVTIAFSGFKATTISALRETKSLSCLLIKIFIAGIPISYRSNNLPAINVMTID